MVSARVGRIPLTTQQNTDLGANLNEFERAARVYERNPT